MPPDMNIPCRTDGELDACKCRYDISSNSFCNEINTFCKGNGSECNVNYTIRQPLPQQNNAPGICNKPIPKHYNINLDKCTCTVRRDYGDWTYVNPRCNYPNNRRTFIADKRSREITITKTGGNKACIFPKEFVNERLLDTPDNKIKGKMNPNGLLQFGAENDNIGSQFKTIEIDNKHVKIENSNKCICNMGYLSRDEEDWGRWWPDAPCPSATDYTSPESAFNITQSRKAVGHLYITNRDDLATDYSCPGYDWKYNPKDFKDYTEIKQTKNYTCPRNCLKEITGWTECNTACPDNLLNGSGTWTRTNKGEQATMTDIFTISKPALGEGIACTNETKNCNTTRECSYNPSLIPGNCPTNYFYSNNQCTEICYNGWTYNYNYINQEYSCSAPKKTTYVSKNVATTCPSGYNIANGKCLKNCDPGYTYAYGICSKN